MNKKFYTLILAIILLPSLFISCSQDDDDSTLTNGNLLNVQMIALNTNDETKEADALLMCNDGSYLLCDADNGSGYSTIYINTSIDNDFSKGTTLFLDEDGTPIMASTDKGRFLFKNITENSFDFAFIDNRGDMSYYWDIPFPYSFDTGMATTRAFYDPLVNAWKSWKSSVIDFDWTWDEHQKKAIVPFLCKMGSFVITAVGIVGGTPVDRAIGVYTIFDEANKSDIINAKWLNYASSSVDFIDLVESSSNGGWSGILKNGKLSFSPKGFGLNVIANFLNQYGDNELANLGNYEERVAPTFEGKEWQIKLSTYLLECSMDEATYSVDVSTKAAWEIDDSNINHSWCSITKENGRVVVKVKEYDGIEDRVCSAKIKISAENLTNDIPPATLTIKQSGIVFDLSAPELIFTQEGGEQGVNVYTNKNVASWKVTSQPDWCKTKNIQMIALMVTVEEDAHLMEDREGTITVTAQLLNGETIDRYLTIKQIVIDMWNGTKWEFSGSVSVSGNTSGYMAAIGNISMSEVTNFGIEIRDVDQNDFTLSGDLAGMEKDSRIYCDAENRLIWSHSETLSESGASVKMTTTITFTRTSSTTAIGKMSSTANVNIPGYGGMNINMGGNFSGTRIDIDD